MYTIYSKYGCPYCDKIKSIMQLAEQKHVVYELGTDYTREEFYEEFGVGTTFPQVIFNDENIGGCTEAVRYFHENNII